MKTSIETQEILNHVLKLCPNNKITKGNIKKIREFNYKNEVSPEFVITTSDVIHACERKLEIKSANRPTLTEAAEHILNFDFNNIAGCVGFERIQQESDKK